MVTLEMVLKLRWKIWGITATGGRWRAARKFFDPRGANTIPAQGGSFEGGLETDMRPRTPTSAIMFGVGHCFTSGLRLSVPTIPAQYLLSLSSIRWKTEKSEIRERRNCSYGILQTNIVTGIFRDHVQARNVS